MPVVDNAIYQGGARVASPATLEETFEARTEHGGFAWIGLYRPTDDGLGTPPPLLCWVHGGPTGQWDVQFRARFAY